MRAIWMILVAILLIGALAATSTNEARSRAKLDSLLAQFDKSIASRRSANDASLKSLRDQIDRAAAQKDAHLSRLFWHTDLQEALSEARATNRPVLSLRLLGRLDEEMSCANSRFFRAILYSDPQISALLRDNFVLHWESVRKVPVITVDFGDGRSFKRTITGNSIHYVLAPTGQVVDALPGLIAPRVFERELIQITQLAGSSWDTSVIRDFQHRTVDRSWTATFSDADITLPDVTLARIGAMMGRAVSNRPTAREAARVAISKSGVERPLLAMSRNPLPALAEDTRLNMAQLRPTILAWLIQSPTVDLKSLNDRVYRELFLTPLDDPWMGLDVPDVFSGLPSVR